MSGRLDDYLRFHETALSLRSQRQQQLASNIANADTPNYKARDIDFNKALEGALARTGPKSPNGLTTTAAGHLAGSNTGTLAGVQLEYRNVLQGSADGNTVDMDVERNQFADNGIRYEASLTMITGQIKSLMAAIQG